MIFLIGTLDTKGAELHFLADILQKHQLAFKIVDVSTQLHPEASDINQREIAAYHPEGVSILESPDRGKAIEAMGTALTTFLSQQEITGVLGIGGSGGTSLICQALRSLSAGVPKIMVSTVASGNTRPYVGASDIFMLYSISDLAGLNSISRRILTNAAHALIGLVEHPQPETDTDKPALGMTMFGVTTPCVQQIRKELEGDYDCMIFHATGIGGQSMEKLIASGLMKHVIDVTLTEVCDHLMGGVLSAGEGRLDAIIETGIPYVGSVGALDMVNFGPIERVPKAYQDRNLYVHNPQVTLMRTTPEENQQMGAWIAEKLNRMTGPVHFFLPEKGVSLIDLPGKAFYDPEADAALFDTLTAQVNQTAQRVIHRLPYDINDPNFSQAIVTTFKELHTDL